MINDSLKIVETSHINGQVFDITELVVDPQWTTNRDSQAGKFTFNIVDNPTVFLRQGDIIEAYWDDKKFFKGKVYANSRKKSFNGWSITAYDLMFLFKSEDTIVFPANNAASRFEQICKILNIPYKIGMVPGYNCTARVADKESFFSMIDDAIQETKERVNARYMIYDDVGTMRFVGYQELNTRFIFGDNSMMTDYDYVGSMEEAYNSVKVIKEDEKNKSREVYQAKDSGSINKFGLLQKAVAPNDAKMNGQQMQEQANNLLKQLNKAVNTFSFEGVGLMPLRAGNNFHLQLEALGGYIGGDIVCSIKSCTHTFLPVHTVNCEVELIL